MDTKKPFHQIEEEIMHQWEKDQTFEKSISQRDENNSYVFYDGPPFATGLPHYGHIVASTMKDIVPRFWAMNGKRVERRWGWDCHGLPIENIVEKEEGLNGRKAIEEFGVAKFNDACETKIGLYAEEWKKTIKRLGRWVDMENDYRTKDLDFMESVWWVFKQLYDKNLVYEGHKSMHICPRCETTLSNIEVSQGYKDVKDLSVTAKFELVDEPGTFILAWTTTPWTLPGNVALAVGADITYSKWEVRDHSVGVTETFIVAEELQQKVLDIMFDETQYGNGKTYEFKESFKGLKLENKQYKPLFDFFVGKDLVNKANLYKVVTADFVSTTDGTGVVHIAPAFGEDDMRLGEEKQLSFIQHVGLDGRYTADVTPWAGQEVKPKEDPTKADVEVLKYLQSKNLYFDNEPITHSYPHCWRCDSPLLNYATSSWFVNITTLKDKLLKNAQAINWVPGHLKEGRFGMWLEGARDWSISRSRFWGNPMPVWKCDKCEAVKVLGGKDELETLTGEKVENIHKQYVDKLTFICEKCEGTMHRIPEVFDCWVESGAMPYGQMHYPFENKEKFEANFPAEFIAEGVDQTRAWFYVMHVLSVALFDKPAYKNVVVNGIVLAEDGKKMSKKLKNYPDPTLVIDKYGADALRYYLATSPVMRADDLCFSEKGVDEVYKKLILITSNILNFYDLFKTEKIEEVKTINVLDQWILAKLHSLIKEVTEKMLVYELPQAAKPINEFIDELSTWYVRRSRDRFKGEEKAAALFTLNQVLAKLALVMAPFTPYMAEHIWQRLGNKDSVHLQDWPKHDDKSIDEKVLEAMTQARLIVEAGLAARDEAGMKVRQPLAELFYTGKELSQDYATIMADELNVLKVTAVETVPAGDGLIIKEHPALKVALDTVLTPELKLAGHLRELVRGVNNLRKNAGLTPGDKVKLYWKTEASELLAMFDDEKLAAELKNSVLAAELINDSVEVAAEFQAEMNVNGMKVVVYLQKN